MVMMEMARPMLFALLAALVLTTLVRAQVYQAGFISIDCGASEDYTDETSGLNYLTDASFRETGVTASISSSLKTSGLARQLTTLRSFPNGTRNCYTLGRSRMGSSKYLIRARFMYGNYDGLNSIPTFDLHLGPNIWDTVEFVNASISVSKEIIVKITSTYTSVCLANTGFGTPFISALELRPIKASIYEPTYGSLVLSQRLDFVSKIFDGAVRYKDDVYDRLWEPIDGPGFAYINTSLTVDADTKNDYRPPTIVMSTAVTPRNASKPIDIFWDAKDPTTEYCIYIHFAEIEKLQPNQTREFTITLNGSLWYDRPFSPKYLATTTLYSSKPKSLVKFFFRLARTENSNLPPLVNAVEIYMVNRLLQAPTSQEEVDAMKNIKSMYGVKRNWQGDPCAPQNYTWDGLNCIFSGYNPPKITYLNLSSSGLTGQIPSYIGDLKSIKILDLSNNNLNGSVPGFLTQLSSLRVLKLTGNNLTGTVPAELIERSESGSLSLSMEGNPNLCMSEKCQINQKKKMVVPIAASIAVVSVFLIASAILWMFILKRRKQQEEAGKAEQFGKKTNLQGRLLDSTNRQFTYAEVLVITNNLKTVIGKGGFGPVYHGYLEETEVAVKMLSSSSVQGYKEFCTEIELLTRIHHRNLTSLVGFCDEGDKIGLIYEYMANGNLKELLSDRNLNVLRRGERLRIALEAATGLEYLHNGCTPPIIHRDVKSANILLNEKLQAKVADFGLSKAFPVDNTHVSTAVAGTPGYLDPEYYATFKLNEKSDVFSFGIVLLEIITGRSVITKDMEENAHISKWVSFMLATDGDIKNVVDTRLGEDFEVNSVQKAVEIAMACASPTSIQRPTMNHVVIELKQCLVTELARLNKGHETKLEGASLNFDSESSLVGR